MPGSISEKIYERAEMDFHLSNLTEQVKKQVEDIQTQTVAEAVQNQMFEDDPIEEVKIEQIEPVNTEVEPPKMYQTDQMFEELPSDFLSSIKFKPVDSLQKVQIEVPEGKYVILASSAYACFVRGLSLAEKTKLLNNEETIFNDRQKFFMTLYNCIEQIGNIKKPTFDQWLKITAASDLPNLIYGVYSETYPNGAKIDLKCSNEKCGHEFKVEYKPNDLIVTKKGKIFDVFMNIDKNDVTSEFINANSLVNKSRFIAFNNKSVVISLREGASLFNLLNAIKVSPPVVLNEFQSIIGLSTVIKEIYLKGPDGEYSVLNTPKLVLEYLISDRVSPEIEDSLEKEMTRIQDISIQFQIKETECPSCKTKIPALSIEPERLLGLKMRGALE